MQGKISVVVPIYNSEQTIAKCIDSALNQSYQDIELILVNDGSTDNSKKIIDSYKDSRIVVIDQKNQGVSASRNRGIEHAKGEYIVFLDSDDVLTNDACEILVRGMQGCDYCITGFQMIGDKNFQRNLKDTSVEEGIYTIDEFGEVFPELFAVGYINAPWAKCFRRNLITSGFDESISIGEDLLFNLSYLRNCKNICVLSKITYEYLFIPANSLSGKISMKYDMQINMYNQCRAVLNSLFDESKKSIETINQKYLISVFSMLNYDIKIKKISNYSEFLDILSQCDLVFYSQKVSLKDIDKKWEVFRVFAKNKLFLLIYILLKIKTQIKR